MNNTIDGASQSATACTDIWSLVLLAYLPMGVTFLHAVAVSANLYEKAPTWVLPGLSIVGSLLSMILIIDMPAFRDTLSPQGLANLHHIQNISILYFFTEFQLLVDRLGIIDGSKRRGDRRWHYASLIIAWLLFISISIYGFLPGCYGEDGEFIVSQTIFILSLSCVFFICVCMTIMAIVTLFACLWFIRTVRMVKGNMRCSQNAANVGILKLMTISSLSTLLGAAATVPSINTFLVLIGDKVPRGLMFICLSIKTADILLSVTLSFIVFHRIVLRKMHHKDESSGTNRVDHKETSKKTTEMTTGNTISLRSCQEN